MYGYDVGVGLDSSVLFSVGNRKMIFIEVCVLYVINGVWLLWKECFGICKLIF